MNPVLIIVIFILIFISTFVVVIFNQLIRSRMKVREAFSGMEVQLKRRYDLIPNLAQIARSFATHEVETLESLENLRKEAASKHNLPGQAIAEDQISTTIRQIFGRGSKEGIGSGNQYFKLQETLIDLEDHIQKARRYYNALVREHNQKCESFPGGVVAALTGIRAEPFFDAPDEETEYPSVQV